MPKKGYRWSEEEDEALRRMCEDGMLHREIAAALSIPKDSVKNRARMKGYSNGYKWTDQEVESLALGISQGKTLQEIGDAIGKSKGAVAFKSISMGFMTKEGERISRNSSSSCSGMFICRCCGIAKPFNRENFRRMGGSCRECEPQITSGRNTDLSRRINQMISNMKTRNRKKPMGMDIDYDYLLSLWDKQEGLCYYTKMKMTIGSRSESTKCCGTNLSADRLDSSKGYLKGNVVLCCWAPNWMKGELSKEEFYSWADLISKNKN